METFKSKQEKVRETTGYLEKLVEQFFRATDNNDENTKKQSNELDLPRV